MYTHEYPYDPLVRDFIFRSSDIPMVFGTSYLMGSDTPEEKVTSKYYQNARANFARDPVKGWFNRIWMADI